MAMSEHSGDSDMSDQNNKRNVNDTGGNGSGSGSDSQSGMGGHHSMPFSALPPAESYSGHNYGLSASLSPGDTLELGVDSRPQVARHRGYETAFLQMPSMTVDLPE